MPLNEHNQPVGDTLGSWQPPGSPDHVALRGRTVDVVPLDPTVHGPALYECLSEAPDALWTYMGFGPFADPLTIEEALQTMVDASDWLPYTFVVDGSPTGFASYLRIQPRDGVIEIGSIVFAPGLQRTTAATEGLYLMIAHTFASGYRRCEWKCDDLNEPSRRAAIRLGFQYEGTFRKATHYKGRSRDTAWYAIVDDDWPRLEAAFTAWMDPANFDGRGRQLKRLEEMR